MTAGGPPHGLEHQNIGAKAWTPALRRLAHARMSRLADASFSPDAYADIQQCIGAPFTVDVAADDLGTNSKCNRFFSPARSFLRATDIGSDECLWVNPPFRCLGSWVRHYHAMKSMQPSLHACFVIPQTPRFTEDPDIQTLQATTRLVKTYPAGHPLFETCDGARSVPWPVHILYDPPVAAPGPTPIAPDLLRTESMRSQHFTQKVQTAAHPSNTEFPDVHEVCPVDDDSSTLTFAASLAGNRVQALLDTGATHNFLDAQTCRRLRLHLRPSPFPAVRFADNSSAPLLGQCTFRMRLGALHAEVTALVLDGMSCSHDLILGLPFMRQHRAMLDIAARKITFRTPRRCITVARSQTIEGGKACTHADSHAELPWENAEFNPKCLATTQIELLTPRDTYRALQNGERFFMAHLKAPPSQSADWPMLRAYAHGDVKPGPVPAEALQSVMGDYADVFQPIPPGPPADRPIHHLIPLVNEHCRPVARPVYKLTPKEEEEARKQIGELLQKGWIRPSQSPWAAPILFAPKADGSLRMCIDYRGLNRLTVQNAYPLPRIDTLLDRLKGATVFSSIDLQAGYHQIKISEADTPKTAFRCALGHFEYTVMPFGLTNAPATFQDLMNRLFKPLIDKGIVTVYLDDILIHSQNAADHLTHIREVLDILRQNKLYAKESKCEWNRTEVTFLGHLVGADGIRMDPKKVEVILQWARPTTQSELRSFLGLANYFRKFILGYASIAAPLNTLIKKSAPQMLSVQWKPEHEEAFEHIKQMIAKDVVLQYPDMNAPFTVISDASLHGTGAVLLQNDRPVAFTSRKFSNAEKNYTTGEQELLGVINALKEWRCYLEGPQITLVTDHHPLIYLQTQNTLSRRQTRWLEFLQRFHVAWEYRPGRTNVADPISRNPSLRYATPEAILRVVTRSQATNPLRERIIAATKVDPWFSDKVNTSDLTQVADGLWQKSITSQIIQKPHTVLVVPNDPELRRNIIQMHHDAPTAGHPGQTRTLELIRRSYWWETMRADVDDYVAHCDKCQRNKPQTGKQPGTLSPLPLPDKPWDSVGIDFVVGLPQTKPRNYNAIVVFVDRLTKMCHLQPTTNKVTAQDTADIFVDAVVKLHGVPQDTVSDRGPQFAGTFWQSLADRLGFKSKLSSAYHPQTDGQTERTNRVVADTLRHYCDTCQNNWDEHLSTVEFAINNAINASTGQTPFYMNYGYHPNIPASLGSSITNPAAAQMAESLASRLARAKRCLQAAQDRMRAQYDKHHKPQIFQIGDRVLLSTQNIRPSVPAKILPRFIGPFEVLEQLGTQAYKLSLPEHLKIHNVFHTSLLKAYKSDGNYQPPPIDWLDGEPYWAVETLLSHRKVPGSGKRQITQYLVRWKGYGKEHDTWEPETQFSDDSLIKAYWATVSTTS